MTSEQIKTLLHAAQQGNIDAKNEFFNCVYDELCKLAVQILAREKASNRLHPIALVHEVYLRLISPTKRDQHAPHTLWQGHQLFFGVAATAMRQVLVDTARRNTRLKRGGDFCQVMLEPDSMCVPEMTGQLLALEDAMSALESLEPKIAEVVRLRFFAGMTLQEVADHMGIGRRTADGYWAYAKTWLMAEMSDAQLYRDKRAS